MQLSRVALAVNALCLECQEAAPRAPTGGGAPLPPPRAPFNFPPVIGYEEVHPEKVRLLEEMDRIVQKACGVFPLELGPGQAYKVWWEEADTIDPVKFERLEPLSFYLHPSCNGTPTCSCPDCRAKT